MIPRKTYKPHFPAFVYLVCFLQPKYTAVWSFSWHYFLSSSLLCIILFSASILIWTLTECFPVHCKYFCRFSIKVLQSDIFTAIFQHLLSFLEEMEPIFVIHNIHSNRWWHHTIWWWCKHIPCIFIQGNYHLWKLSLLARKDHCFRPYFLSISCKLIWELTYGHWVYIDTRDGVLILVLVLILTRVLFFST